MVRLLMALCAAVPFVVAIVTTSPFAEAEQLHNEEYCLALNVYHEARSESVAGQYAVADVVLNRVESKHFPNSIVAVVKQAKLWEGHPVRHRCHFSWYCDGKSDEPTELNAWYRSMEVAQSILYADRFRGITEGANHYHTQYVDPSWNRNMRLIGSIGDHVFYYEER